MAQASRVLVDADLAQLVHVRLPLLAPSLLLFAVGGLGCCPPLAAGGNRGRGMAAGGVLDGFDGAVDVARGPVAVFGEASGAYAQLSGALQLGHGGVEGQWELGEAGQLGEEIARLGVEGGVEAVHGDFPGDAELRLDTDEAGALGGRGRVSAVVVRAGSAAAGGELTRAGVAGRGLLPCRPRRNGRGGRWRRSWRR